MANYLDSTSISSICAALEWGHQIDQEAHWVPGNLTTVIDMTLAYEMETKKNDVSAKWDLQDG
jgi:hypothetical protein